MNPTQILVLRTVIALVLLLLTIGVSKPALLRPEATCRKWSLIAGVFGSIGLMAYFWSLTRMDASLASMLIATSPLFVLAALTFFGEPITSRHLLRMGLALAGVYLLIGPGGQVDLVGLVLILVALCSYTAQYVIVQEKLAKYDARSVTLYVIGAMTACVFLFWLAQGMPWRNPTSGEWFVILVLGLVSTYGARLALFAAVARIGSAQASMLTPVEVLLTILWSMLFLGEQLTPVQWAGGILVLSSLLLAYEGIGRSRTATSIALDEQA
jgi:drug/metabolite transporter (DMT)-like permease